VTDEALAALLAAPDLDAIEQVLHRYGRLTGDVTVELLDRLAADGNAALTLRRKLIERCRIVGVAEAFGELRGQPVGVTAAWEQALATDDPARAEAAWRRVLDLLPHETDRPSPAARVAGLDGLAHLLFADSDGDDLDETADLWRRAAAETTDPADRADYRTNLGAVLARRHEAAGRLQDLDEAAAVFTAAAHTAAADPLTRASAWSGLGNIQITRYEMGSDRATLDAAIRALTEAVGLVAMDHPARPEFLNNLGLGLLTRYEVAGAEADLQRAVAVLDEVVESGDDSPVLLSALANLADARLQAYRNGGDPDDLERAVTAVERALAHPELSPVDRPGFLNTRGSCLLSQYARRGDLDDLDLAISAFRQAVAGTAPAAPERVIYLDSLASARRDRFLRTDDEADLREAIAAARDAVATTGPDAAERPRRLTTLANCLATGAHPERLDEAVACYRAAFDLAPRYSPEWFLYAAGVAAGLLDRYEAAGDAADLDQAVERYEQAIEAAPAGVPELAALWHNRAAALRRRHESHGDPNDLDRTIRCSPPAPETRCPAMRSPTCSPSTSTRQHPAARA
jgi:tetratricopeptide (TPR) repeat protein